MTTAKELAEKIPSLEKRIAALEKEKAAGPRKEPAEETTPPSCPIREECIGNKCAWRVRMHLSAFSLAKGLRSEQKGCCAIVTIAYIMANNCSDEARAELFSMFEDDSKREEKSNGTATRP